LFLNKKGYPIGHILIPEAASGHMLRSTHMAIMPESDLVVICASDETQRTRLRARLYIARGFANYNKSYQYL
jgi:hypothetical protein